MKQTLGTLTRGLNSQRLDSYTQWPSPMWWLLQTGVFALAITMCVLARMPWPVVAGLALLSTMALGAGLLSQNSKGLAVIPAVISVIVVATVVVSAVLTSTLESYLDEYYALIALLVAAGIALTRRRNQRSLAIVWSVLALAVWLAATYAKNEKLFFHFGMVAAIVLAVLCHWLFRPSGFVFHLLNCIIFATVGIGAADFFIHPGYKLAVDPEARRSYYSYEKARRDPTAFARWWSAYLDEWGRVEKQLYVPDPAGYLPYRLRPNTYAMLFQNRIRINSRGFRGPEFSEPKGDAYRIIALGESTTFGITLNAEDRPWPELLQQMIVQRLKPDRPVQVINAGVPGYQLQNNFARLQSELLTLHPDLIISYHGLNGFPMLHGALPGVRADNTAPTYRERPLRLLADMEYKFRVAQFRRYQLRSLARRAPVVLEPMRTPYAQAYRSLCDLASAQRIRLVLATYSMAVNSGSPPAAVEFYQASYPATPWLIKANALHSQILKQIAAEHPGVLLVDTTPVLDGVTKYYLDLVHFSPAGEKQFAEVMFAGIEHVLRQELAPQAGTTPR